LVPERIDLSAYPRHPRFSSASSSYTGMSCAAIQTAVTLKKSSWVAGRIACG
jgi:hypothetical protein